MKHKHHDLIVAWAANKDLQIEWRQNSNNNWSRTKNPGWDEHLEYRIADPYKELKEAYNAGKTIQFKMGDASWEDILTEPSWAWGLNLYRIKPEPEYVPFNYNDCILFVGKVVINKINKQTRIIISYDSQSVYCGNNTKISFDDLLNGCTFTDGSRCGKLK